jgi:hypothetical protein
MLIIESLYGYPVPVIEIESDLFKEPGRADHEPVFVTGRSFKVITAREL